MTAKLRHKFYVSRQEKIASSWCIVYRQGYETKRAAIADYEQWRDTLHHESPGTDWERPKGFIPVTYSEKCLRAWQRPGCELLLTARRG